uniref:Uncharacterized protein n=1 Tax=Nelumbo nucifera TaxID=4432 RepID=A0A822Y1K9_NELNU|nr:TPA_asm: hypothetical protein HUJ06_027610 [Nelumbo nucifera]
MSYPLPSKADPSSKDIIKFFIHESTTVNLVLWNQKLVPGTKKTIPMYFKVQLEFSVFTSPKH